MTAVLLVGHGSHLDPNSSAPVHAHARRLRELGCFREVRTAFWKEEPSLSRGLDGFEGDSVTVVPIFISSGYFTEEVIPREMGLRGRVSVVDGRCVRYTAPIGAHPALSRVIVQRAEQAGARGDEALVVLGHGTPRNPNSERNVYRQAEFVRAEGRFREVATVFMDQEPNLADTLSLVASERVIMVPLFIADGWHVGQTIPDDLALDGAETRRDGRTLRYTGAVGTHPSVVDVICELVEEAAKW